MRNEAAIRVYETIRTLARRIPFASRIFQALRRMEAARSQPIVVTAPDQANGALREAIQARDLAEEARWEAVRRYESLERGQGGLGADGIAPIPILSIPRFWEPNYWEPTVQFPLRDYCRAGDVVFDVGANAGGLSMLMSRLVGPRGAVCAFEASPRVIAMTLRNLVSGGCSNVQLYHCAVYHTSHESVAIYAGSDLNDTIYPVGGPQGADFHKVKTLSLDDFTTETKLVPKLIKMDIEGAELDALQGMKRLLSDTKPVLILEQSPTDMRCHKLLSDSGYVAIDLANYRRIRSAADFEPGVTVANILFVHSSAGDDPYLDETPPALATQIEASAFTRSADGGFQIEEAAILPAGRYICRAGFSASGTDNEIFAGVEVDGEVVLRYQTHTRLMAESYRNWVFTLLRSSRVAPYLRFIKGKDETLEWRGVSIVRLNQFDRLPPPVVD